MKKVLLIHHLETAWCHGFKLHGTTFEDECERVISYLKKNSDLYHEIILVRCDDSIFESAHFEVGLHEHIDRVEEYAYGWSRKCQIPSLKGIEWDDGCDHSEVVMLPQWLKDLKDCDVRVCGAFRRECIETLCTALKRLKIRHYKLHSLIVG